MNSSREIVNMALNRKANNAASIPKGWRHDASGQWWKPGRFVAYKGVPYQIVDDSDPDGMKLKPVSGGSIISARDTELDAIVKNATAPDFERRLKTILSTEMPKVKKLYADARSLDKSIKDELKQLMESDEISDKDANRLGKMVYDIRVMSPFGSL